MRPSLAARATGQKAADPPRPLRLRTDSGSAGSPRKRCPGEPSEGFRPRSCESREPGGTTRKGRVRPRTRLAGVFGPPGLAPGGPRHSVHGTRRQDDGSELDAPSRFGGGGVGPARKGDRQEDLEGERSPGRTVLASPVTNPVREARTRRWSKALKRPTLPVEPGSASTRKGGGGSAAVPGARSMPGELAVTSVVEEAPGDVWRSAEQSVGQSPSNRRGRPVSLSGCESGRLVPGGRWNRKKATAAVTRCGCWRGDSSRGTKRVAGMAMCAAAGLPGPQERHAV